MNRPIFPIAFFSDGDGYTTSQKIMGRQSTGQSLIKGLAEFLTTHDFLTYGSNISGAQALSEQFKKYGYAGNVLWSPIENLQMIGPKSLYIPAPPSIELANLRSLLNFNDKSFIGITHTLSSKNAVEQIANLAIYPFKNHDAIICTSQAAKDVVVKIQNDHIDWLKENLGANKFSNIQTPVIPLGINTKDFLFSEADKNISRKKLGISHNETVLFSPGRMTFHAKANPYPLYEILEELSQSYPLVCIESGVYPNKQIEEAYKKTRATVAPSVKFIYLDGGNINNYMDGWKSADIFISLADNIQETFGITLIEAMAAGLPIIASDWSGYRDTIKNGVNGFTIQTLTPAPGYGSTLGLNYILNKDSYDFYIGKTSLACSINFDVLKSVLIKLITQKSLRIELGTNGRKMAQSTYDWKNIIPQYLSLSKNLEEMAPILKESAREIGLKNMDPFTVFSIYSSEHIGNTHQITPNKHIKEKFLNLRQLSMFNFCFNSDQDILSTTEKIIDILKYTDLVTVGDLIIKTNQSASTIYRSITLLSKFNLIKVSC